MRRPAKNKTDILIIGGGASGLAAACVMAGARKEALLLEKEQRLGRKLMATGNGRCNLFNTGAPVFFGGATFAEKVLSRCGVREVSEFFESLGLQIREEEGGRAYPMTGQAASVLDCLKAGMQACHSLQVITGCAVVEIRRFEGRFAVLTEPGDSYIAQRLILASGSPAAPHLGGSGAAAAMAAGLGHRLIPFRPVLSALVTDVKDIKGLSGLRLPAYLTLFQGDRPIDASAGEILFTDTGVSGVCAMQLAGMAGEAILHGEEVVLSLDFSPLAGLSEPLMRRLDPAVMDRETAKRKMLGLLQKRLEGLGVDRLYTGLLPSKLAGKVQGLPLHKAAEQLSGLRLKVLGIRSFDQAQAAAGGLDTGEFDPETLESRLIPGLYVTGEALNVDGDTGGFNLLFAWASGILAARHALER
jgi:predicted Rossmann fold flavoprotein